jgi:hypothetical protein
MFTLKLLNVVKIVETEGQKLKLINKGYKVIEETIKKVEGKVIKGKAK